MIPRVSSGMQAALMNNSFDTDLATEEAEIVITGYQRKASGNKGVMSSGKTRFPLIFKAIRVQDVQRFTIDNS